MKLIITSISQKLSFRLFTSICTVIVSVGLIFHFFFFIPLSDINEEIIHDSLSEHASQLQSICEQQYTDILRSGSGFNSPLARVKKGLTLGLIEEFMVNHDLSIIVANNSKLVVSPGKLSTVNIKSLFALSLPDTVSRIQLNQIEYYALKQSFSPWQWDIFILKESGHFKEKIDKLHQLYTFTFLTLLIGAFIIFSILLRQIKTPINQIINAVKNGNKPSYRGISELEYLSESLRISLEEQEQKSSELQRVNKDLEQENAIRKKTETELIESESRYRSLYLNTPALLHSINRKGQIVSVSNSWLEKMGYTREEIIGKQSTDFLTENSRQYAIETILPLFFEKGYCHDVSYQFVKKDGEVIDVLLSAILEYDHLGKPLQSLAVTTDISELRRHEQMLFESEKKYRSLIETTDTGFLIHDGQGTVLDANQEYVRLTGHQYLSQIKGRNVIEWIAEYDQRKYEECADKCLVANSLRNLEIDYMHFDGTVVPVEVNATVIPQEGKTKVLALFRDVTQRKQISTEKENLIKELHKAEYEIQREKMHNQLLAQSKLAALGQLATGVAHEINQPLTYIQIMLQALLKNIEKERLNVDELVEDSQYSLKQIGRITQIINHLRVFGKDDETVFDSVDIRDVLQDTLILMGQQLKLNNIVLSQQVPDNLPLVYGNAIQLEQVFINLFQNAIDALKGKNDKIVKVSLRTKNMKVYIEVSDNGSGIPESIQEKIFEPFFTTKDQGEGTGIGLSIVYGIITKHKGNIQCLPTPEGSSFLISLPQYE